LWVAVVEAIRTALPEYSSVPAVDVEMIDEAVAAAHESVPAPLVVSAWFADPSADGRVYVTPLCVSVLSKRALLRKRAFPETSSDSTEVEASIAPPETRSRVEVAAVVVPVAIVIPVFELISSPRIVPFRISVVVMSPVRIGSCGEETKIALAELRATRRARSTGKAPMKYGR
jgi:hypothetical protein